MPLDTAYVAGLFDGEGWVRINKGPMRKSGHIQHQLVVGISLTNWPIIKALNETFPTTIFRKFHYHQKNPNNKVSFCWRIQSQRAADFLFLIRPWLIVKTEEVDLALQFQRHIAENKNVLVYDPSRRDEFFALRDRFMDQIRTLKKRNWNALNGSDPISDAA